MERYIGLDVHAASCTLAVISQTGRRLRDSPVETPNPTARWVLQQLREAFPDFRAEIHWQAADGDLVTTFKTYHGTHRGSFFGIAPTGREIQFETVDAMRVRDGQIVEHWGVANLLSLLEQLGAVSLTP